MGKNQNTVCKREERRRIGPGLTGKGHEETVKDNGIILYADRGICKCQNSFNSKDLCISLMQILQNESIQILNSM